jgi:hypothetical protein
MNPFRTSLRIPSVMAKLLLLADVADLFPKLELPSAAIMNYGGVIEAAHLVVQRRVKVLPR